MTVFAQKAEIVARKTLTVLKLPFNAIAGGVDQILALDH